MPQEQYKDFWLFIRLLADNALLEHVIVIGSWAEYLYAQAGILPDYDANLRTLDIDFLIKNLRRPTPKANISSLARDAGYTVDNDLLTGTTKIYTPGLMEIEFLISQQGAGDSPMLKTNLGINAQALRHLAVLRDNTIIAEFLDMKITVPVPEAYALHKITINAQRGRKQEKDRLAILHILPYLNKERMASIYGSLTKKEKATVQEFFEENQLDSNFLTQ